jgi:hypothetical protein
VSERGSNLATRTEKQVISMVEFLSGLTEADRRAACTDDRGVSTVGGVAVHVAVGYGQICIFLEGQITGARDDRGFGMGKAFRRLHDHVHGHGNAADHGHEHDHDDIDLRETIETLSTDGTLAARLLGELTDELLDRPVPKGEIRFADGKRPLIQILDGIVDHQSSHLNTMQKAVSAARSQETA